MNDYDNIKLEISELVEMGNDFLNSLTADAKKEKEKYSFFFLNYQNWYSKALSIIKQLMPDRLNDFIELYKNEKRKEITPTTYTLSDAVRGIEMRDAFGNLKCSSITATNNMLNQIKILGTCLDVFENKIYNIQTILQADIFDSEIESARHLEKMGFLRAAGAICGVVLEKHFSKVASNHNIKVSKKNPTIADFNEVFKDNIYNTLEWRRIQRLADLRNLCTHKKDKEPTNDEVAELIDGTDRVIKTIF